MTNKWKNITKGAGIGFFLGIVGQILSFVVLFILGTLVMRYKLPRGTLDDCVFWVFISPGLFVGIGGGILYKSLKKVLYGLIFGVIAWLLIVIIGTKITFIFYNYTRLTNSLVLIIGIIFYGLCIGFAKNIDTKSLNKIKRSMIGGIIGGIVSSILIFLYFILFRKLDVWWMEFYSTLTISIPIIGALIWFFIELIDNKYTGQENK